MNLEAFLAHNVEKVEVTKKAVSKRFKDKDGKPIEWHFAPIDGTVDQKNRKEATVKRPVPGKKGLFMPELDANIYMLKNAVDSIKYPNLRDAALQDSYGVKEPEALLSVMLLPGELQEVYRFTQEINGFDLSLGDLVEEAKN